MWHEEAVRRGLLLGLGLVALVALGRPSVAHAYERQVGLTLELGYSTTPIGMLPAHGIYVQGGVSVGLGDTWELRARLDYAFHPEPMHRWSAGAELVYLVDIFEVVPYLGVGVAGLVTLTDTLILGDFAVGGVVGLDVLLSREVTLGFVVRPYAVVTSLDYSPLWLEAGARLQFLIPY